MPDRRFSRGPQLPSLELKDLQYSEVVKEWPSFGSIGTVHHGNRDILSVRRDRNPFGCWSDGNLIDSSWRVRREIDETHHVDAACGACADVRNYRHIPSGSDIHSIRLKAGKEITLGVLNVDAVDGQQ